MLASELHTITSSSLLNNVVPVLLENEDFSDSR